MTEICGSRVAALRYASRSVTGSSIANTCGRSRNIARLTSTANSSLPGTTGKYVNRPRFRFPKSGRNDPGSSGIAEGFFAEDLDHRGFQRVRFVARMCRKAPQLDSVTADVNAVANRIPLIS